MEDVNCGNTAPHAAHDFLATNGEFECRGIQLAVVEWPQDMLPVVTEPAERTSSFEQAPPYPVQRPYDWDQHKCARCDVDRLLSHAAWHSHMLRQHKSGGIQINCPGDTCEGAWPVASDEEKRAIMDYLRLMLIDVKWDSRALFEELVYLRRKYQHIMDFPKPQPSSAGSPSTRRRD